MTQLITPDHLAEVRQIPDWSLRRVGNAGNLTVGSTFIETYEEMPFEVFELLSKEGQL